MIKRIKQYLIENIAYVVVFTFAVIYITIDNGVNYLVNYASILLTLFIPIFIVINLYGLIKSLLLKEIIDNKELALFVILISLTVVAYVFGLEGQQRIILGIINGISSCLIIMIMGFKTISK